MRAILVVMFVLLGLTNATRAEVNVGISIGINVPVYPRLTVVPGYPVYYDPYADGNYFFYDGQYWVYENDNWYASGWYNGPWVVVEPVYVPVYVLRVPVRYYRRPSVYFAAWHRDAPPHWGEHWGHDWEQHRRGWDHWDRRAVPRPAPLPTYQRQYSGERYPREIAQQRILGAQNYHYQPRDPAVQHVQRRLDSAGPAAAREQAHGNPQPQKSSRQPPPLQQRAIEQSHRPQNQPGQREHDPARREQAVSERAHPVPPPHPPLESHDRGREAPPAPKDTGRERGNHDARRDNDHDNRR